MPIKATGAEWKRFYADPAAWPEGAWHEDEEVKVDGVLADDNVDLAEVLDTALLSISGGVVYLHEADDEGPTLETHFKRWRKAQSTVFMVVECPTARAEAVATAIRNAGARVLG
jgi:hypothetical protein